MLYIYICCLGSLCWGHLDRQSSADPIVHIVDEEPAWEGGGSGSTAARITERLESPELCDQGDLRCTSSFAPVVSPQQLQLDTLPPCPRGSSPARATPSAGLAPQRGARARRGSPAGVGLFLAKLNSVRIDWRLGTVHGLQ